MGRIPESIWGTAPYCSGRGGGVSRGAWHRAAGAHGIDALLDADLNDQAEQLAQAMIDLLVSVTATSPVLKL